MQKLNAKIWKKEKENGHHHTYLLGNHSLPGCTDSCGKLWKLKIVLEIGGNNYFWLKKQRRGIYEGKWCWTNDAKWSWGFGWWEALLFFHGIGIGYWQLLPLVNWESIRECRCETEKNLLQFIPSTDVVIIFYSYVPHPSSLITKASIYHIFASQSIPSNYKITSIDRNCYMLILNWFSYQIAI